MSNPTDLLDDAERILVEAGLDALLDRDVLDGYEYGVASERTHAHWVVMLYSPTRGTCIGVGATLMLAANNALDVLGGDCECDPGDDVPEAY